MTAGGRAMRWDCAVRGCFNETCRPKLEAFSGCFPRAVNFGDIDGMVELNGCFCLLEWKGPGGAVKLGQYRSYIQFTRHHHGNVVFIVGGDATTMQVRNFAIVWRGQCFASQPGDLAELKRRLRAWAVWAETLRGAA
jgi:hypothetical protein